MIRRLAVLACALLAGALPSFAAGTKLAPKDIQTTFFTGEPFTAATPSNVKFKMVFSPDGTATREPAVKGGAKAQGTWKLSKDGFCSAWSGSKPNCYTVVASAANKWSVMSGMALKAIWSK